MASVTFHSSVTENYCISKIQTKKWECTTQLLLNVTNPIDKVEAQETVSDQ